MTAISLTSCRKHISSSRKSKNGSCTLIIGIHGSERRKTMVIRGRAPLRVSFGGGGTDVAPFCEQQGGAIIGSTINKYCILFYRTKRG